MAPRRLAPLVACALVAFAAGVVLGARHVPSERALAARWGAAWERADYDAMYALLSDDARARTSRAAFARAYRSAAGTLTLTRLSAGRAGSADGAGRLPVAYTTRIFGTVRGTLQVPVAVRGDGLGVAWSPHLVFPGLRAGQKLVRSTRLPRRATIEARDGTAIAKGDDRTSALGPSIAGIAGQVGRPAQSRASELEAYGVPPGASVGITGLEREFDAQLTGRPGGVLMAGERLVAHSEPIAGEPVRTTIDPEVQAAAVAALAGRYGGIAVIRPRDGEVLALAGIASSAPQPPGSTFKIITLAAALQNGVVKADATFPIQTMTTLEGVKLRNANDEACGGSLKASFAESCNSVFAPLGAKLGARRLVAAAERFGFNRDPGLSAAAQSTIPAAEQIGDDLAVGSTAIGQGRVLATPLAMAVVSATIGNGGRRPTPTLERGAGKDLERIIPASVARTVRSAMRAVVTDGTGGAAAVPGVSVAGKTGTAELRNSVRDESTPPADDATPAEEDTSDTDAWFTAFAPLKRPEVAVTVLLVAQGAGGATAAPLAAPVIRAAVR